MEKILIKPETAERLRKAAPTFGMNPNDIREMEGDFEVVRVDPAIAESFHKRRKAAKISADSLVLRLLKGR